MKLCLIALLALTSCTTAELSPYSDRIIYNPVLNTLPNGNWICQPIPGAIIQQCDKAD